MGLSTTTFGWLRDGIGNAAAARDIEKYLGLEVTGNIYYYDPTSGSDNNTGNVSSDAKATLNAAIGLCSANNGDIIINMRGTETVTETVEFDVAGISVIPQYYGVNPYVMGEYSALLADASFTDGPVATITQPCTIIGMGFAGRDTEATFFGGAACLIGGAAAGAFGVHLAYCRFPKWGLDNRIGLALAGGAAVSDCLIEHCGFEGVGADFDAGIYMQGACQNITIRDNDFRQCTAAVQFGAFAGGGPHIKLHGNWVEDGLVLDSQGNTANGMVSGNWSELAAASSYDASVATLQGQGIQFSGNNYSE